MPFAESAYTDPTMDTPNTKATAQKRFSGGLQMHSVIAAIQAGEAFSAIKLCHGFWEHWVRFERRRSELGLNLPLADEQWKAIISQQRVNWPAELFLDVRRQLAFADERPDVLTLVSPFGWSDGFSVEGTPFVGLADTQAVIDDALPACVPRLDGLFWKNALQDGSFVNFIDSLRDRPTLVVGPPHAAEFGDFAGLKHCQTIEVDGRRAAWHRQEDLERISEAVSRQGSSGLICLMQAGGANSAWLISELAQRFPESFFLSLGRALDVAALDVLRSTNWYAIHHEAINRTLSRINRDWPERHRPANQRPTDPWARQKRNLEPALEALLEPTSKDQADSNKQPMAFIENKPVDEVLLNQLLEHSRQANHWANFGPVSRLLEQAIARLLTLPDDRQVVTCKSATDAIHGLVAVHELHAGRPLRWVVSAFGFYSTGQGPLAGATVLDCNGDGLIDLEALQSLPADDWDGVVITNPFATAVNLTPWLKVIRDAGKKVILDNAAALFTGARDHQPLPEEAISFHQTKPWGMGEGGCVIARPEFAETFRSLTNFGVGLDGSGAAAAMNSKLSDFDAALVLQRLANLPNWRPRYEMQRRRLLSIALPLGFRPLGQAGSRKLLQAHVPLLAPRAISKSALDNPLLTLRKYYAPLEPGHPVATDLFERVVCVPCHPDVRHCASSDLERLLAGLINQ